MTHLPSQPWLRKIKAARKKKGITQERMAEALRTKLDRYSKIENGKLDLKFVEADIICKILGIKLWEIVIDGKNSSHPFTKEEMEIVNKLRALTPKRIEILELLLEEFQQ